MSSYKALAIVGDHGHPAENARRGLGPVFQALGVPCEFTEDYRKLSSRELAGVHLLALYRIGSQWDDRPGLRALPDEYVQEMKRLRRQAGWPEERVPVPPPYGMWMTPEQESALMDFVTQGGSFLAVHNANAFYPKDGPYRQLLGAHFVEHPAIQAFDVKVVDHRHPVTRGVGDYQVVDEQYFFAYDADRITVLTKSVSKEGEQPSAWVRQQGRGRVCFVATGHHLETLLAPQVQKLFHNAVRWCLKMPGASGEAP